MSEAFLRPKSPTGGRRLTRVPSGRSKLLSRFFDTKGDERERRISKEELVSKGILKPEAVFGNDLRNLPLHPTEQVPQFLVECVFRIESMIDTEGIYRVNGDAADVQKIRYEVDRDNYRCLDTKDVTLLASTLKLFLRELPEPIITKEVRDELYKCYNEKDLSALVASIRKALTKLASVPLCSLNFILLHLKKVADESSNKMGVRNLATVFSPCLVHSITQKRRPESIISEMELNNIIVEQLIEYVEDIFA